VKACQWCSCPRRCLFQTIHSIIFPPQSTRGSDRYVLVYARSPHRPTRLFLRIHGKRASCIRCIMPNNIIDRSVLTSAHLLRPSAYADSRASKAFIEETHTQREKLVAKPSSAPWHQVWVVSGIRFPITQSTDSPRCLRAGIEAISRASSLRMHGARATFRLAHYQRGVGDKNKPCSTIPLN
jgi:hypothetical protein